MRLTGRFALQCRTRRVGDAAYNGIFDGSALDGRGQRGTVYVKTLELPNEANVLEY